jgi:endo-1,4-beta-mannosidase
MEDPGSFLMGINYWPAETGLFWWRRFDLGVVNRDFSLLADHKFGVVRIFLVWEDFQPGERHISVPSLNHLVQVAELAHDLKLRLLPTFFTGHMRGVNWLPPWMVERGAAEEHFPVFSRGEIQSGSIRNMYGDREIWKAQKLLLHETTGALEGHPAVWGWDLGNEPTNMILPPSKEMAQAWLEQTVEELKRYDSDLPVTLGLHQEDLEEDRGLGPREVAQFCDILSIHAYPCHAKWSDGPIDQKAALFLALLTGWLGRKHVLLEEFGVPIEPPCGELASEDRERLGGIGLVQEDHAEAYLRGVLERLMAYGVTGAFVWCFSDFEAVLWDYPPLNNQLHERFFGLFRSDGTAKKTAKLLFDLDRRTSREALDSVWIDITQDEYWERPREHLKRLYGRFKDALGEVD